MKKIVVATQNRGKFSEIKVALKGLGWEILPAYKFQGVPEIIEDGTTLEENSLKKAHALSIFTGLPSLADDTGLFVEALNGAPGIYAARFAGENCTYEDNVKKLLSELKNVPELNRTAVFRTVITIFYPTGKMDQVSGQIEGKIILGPKGIDGFGYDPIFLPKGCTKVFAEMSLDEKNKISHRGKALNKIKELLKNNSL